MSGLQKNCWQHGAKLGGAKGPQGDPTGLHVPPSIKMGGGVCALANATAAARMISLTNMLRVDGQLFVLPRSVAASLCTAEQGALSEVCEEVRREIICTAVFPSLTMRDMKWFFKPL